MFKIILAFILGAFKLFFKAAFPVIKQEILSALRDIAMKAVLTAQETGLDNESKRKKAFGMIKDYAMAKGITTKDHLIDLALAMAVSAMKGKDAS